MLKKAATNFVFRSFEFKLSPIKGSTSQQLSRQYGIKTRDAGRENGFGDLDHVLLMAIEES